MTIDKDFYDHLGTLNKGGDRQKIYRDYKSSVDNFCFDMNGALRLGFDTSSYQSLIDSLSQIFCAKNNSTMVLYRMTSDLEFTPNICAVQTGGSFRYPAFLSTARRKAPLTSFVPCFGVPTLLEITCPAGTQMALMEGTGSSGEEEVLLCSNTEYRINSVVKESCQSTLTQLLGQAASKHQFVYVIKIEVTNNPITRATFQSSDFFAF